MTDATVVIKGRSELGLAVKTAQRQLEGLARQGELIGKIFRGGAILGAVIAFERLAENAQKAAEAMGERGTARSLKALNREIDNLKSKGTNVIGQVLGETYALTGRAGELSKVSAQISSLRGQLDGFSKVGASPRGSAELLAQIALLEKRRTLLEKTLPFGERTRAPGSRSNGRAVQETPWLREDVAKPGKSITAAPQISESMLAIQKEFDDASRYFLDMEVAATRAGEAIEENFNSTLEASLESLTILPQTIKVASSEMTLFADQAARNMQTGFANFLFDPFKDGLEGMVAGFADSIRRMIAEAAAAQILNAFLNWGSGLGGKAGSFFSSIPRRAAGGPVTGGMPHIVGERGPELFVPGSSGSIVPNHAIGGVVINQSFDVRGADAERIMAIMPGLLQRTKAETVAEVRNLIARGRM